MLLKKGGSKFYYKNTWVYIDAKNKHHSTNLRNFISLNNGSVYASKGLLLTIPTISFCNKIRRLRLVGYGEPQIIIQYWKYG